MLQRWRKTDNWGDAARDLRCGFVWCIKIYFSIFSLITRHYRRVLGINPPTVEEYLFSANHNLLIPVQEAEGIYDNFGDEGDYARLYYHIM